MNKNSNKYIIAYATVLVVVVATLLSVAALSLKERQDNNERVEKMGDILRSIGKAEDADKVADKFAYISDEYNKYITRSFAVNPAGEVVLEGEEAFNITLSLKEQYDKPEADRVLPVFEATLDDGSNLYVIPLWGSGLWGPIWGYVALADDYDTIYGTSLGHKSETPGLGAEIATPGFSGQLTGKRIYNGDRLVAVSVVKGGGSSEQNLYQIDAVSGGTITSRAVETMLKTNLSNYDAWFAGQRIGSVDTSQPEIIDNSWFPEDSTVEENSESHE